MKDALCLGKDMPPNRVVIFSEKTGAQPMDIATAWQAVMIEGQLQNSSGKSDAKLLLDLALTSQTPAILELKAAGYDPTVIAFGLLGCPLQLHLSDTNMITVFADKIISF
ncbi:hypothetical protein A2160_01460 [Candidatus Beckwithbacteria bacterium RBG_13_42_9]|uniref:Uncharacterized protein n=1 Tax=Candidatus Beckwithbacteria bacterium RBG_13_42_9 TaxID=1797457 RepID=A0A1F5E909_9BACT|nr:MAG: hypothetical protein A2160_01460 [Candidatus Beckwithbacteria bacterium RBG_13_42_9]